MKIGLKNINVKFGQLKSDIIIEYTICLGVSKSDDPQNELFYDELKILTSLKLKTMDNTLNITSFKYKFINDSENHEKNLPLRNKMNIDQRDYKEFIK